MEKQPINKYLTDDYSPWEKYDKYLLSTGNISYSALIRREQKFLSYLINNKYKDTKDNPLLVMIVYIHSDFGKRKEEDYKLVIKYSVDYNRFIDTDDYTEIATFAELKAKYQKFL